MGYRLAADAVLLLHAAFVLFALFGSLLALRWPKLAWLHVPAVIWVVLLEFNGWYCPLTPLEVTLRQYAGDAGYAGGFLEHYVVAALYPDGLTHTIQIVLGAALIGINLAGYALLWRRSRTRRALARNAA